MKMRWPGFAAHSYRHVFPGLSPDPDDDRTRKRSTAARARRAAWGFLSGHRGLAEVGLGHRLTHYPGQLSGGEQQRVAIARAFIARPKLLLADEPTGNLDAATGRLVIDCLFEHQARHGTTLLLITHDQSVAERCERQIHLLDGTIVKDRRNAPSPVGAAWRVR
jgi:predicted ABC-type transport system involved in lysophospholipase L1 biosynthesis ATPase subunit